MVFTRILNTTKFKTSKFLSADQPYADSESGSKSEESRKEEIMTLNVINYFRELEDKRSHQAQEALKAQELEESQRHNIATEAETQRHNVVSENEVTRHNLETEELGRNTLAETVRHNTVTENVSWYSAKEQSRHNQEVERETRTHDRAQEKYWVHSVSAEEYKADRRYDAAIHSAMITASNAANVLTETKRHNEATEGVTERGQNISAVIDAVRVAEDIAKAVVLGVAKKAITGGLKLNGGKTK